MGSCAAPSAKGDDKFITTDYLQQCRFYRRVRVGWRLRLTRPTRPRLTHDKFPLCFLTYNRACFPSHWCYPWRIN
ncbi:hypothetical protein C3B80_01940 [Enterobacter cloacae]|nr:hypothetical protein C3B80_01940 [Enterobacter cloacae]